nr:ribosomal protein S8 [Cyanidioschyzonaceae sp. 1 FvB-2021]
MTYMLKIFSNHVNAIQHLNVPNLVVIYTPLLLDLLHLFLREKLIMAFVIKNGSKIIIKFNPRNKFFLRPIQQPNTLKYVKKMHKKIYFDLIYSTSKGLYIKNYYSNEIVEGQPLLLVFYNKL